MTTCKFYHHREGNDEQIYINNPFEDSTKPAMLRLVTQDMLDYEVRKVVNDMSYYNEPLFHTIYDRLDNSAAIADIAANITPISSTVDELKERLMALEEILEDNIRTSTENQKSLHEILRAKYNNELIPLKKVD